MDWEVDVGGANPNGKKGKKRKERGEEDQTLDTVLAEGQTGVHEDGAGQIDVLEGAGGRPSSGKRKPMRYKLPWDEKDQQEDGAAEDLARDDQNDFTPSIAQLVEFDQLDSSTIPPFGPEGLQNADAGAAGPSNPHAAPSSSWINPGNWHEVLHFFPLNFHTNKVHGHPDQFITPTIEQVLYYILPPPLPALGNRYDVEEKSKIQNLDLTFFVQGPRPIKIVPISIIF